MRAWTPNRSRHQSALAILMQGRTTFLHFTACGCVAVASGPDA